MHIYRGTLELLDYVFYATVERGKVYETGSFIHNYALAYAFGLAKGVPYTQLRQQPRYRQDLIMAFHSTPARCQRFRPRISFE